MTGWQEAESRVLMQGLGKGKPAGMVEGQAVGAEGAKRG